MSPVDVRQVDSLTIDVLVDNTIEWFYPYPPQFTSELPLQIRNDPPLDTNTGVPIADLENLKPTHYNEFETGAHGLGLLVKTVTGGEEHTILFDAGPESKSIARNVAAMKTDLSKVERIVLSHWHSDHSGGILTALNMIKDHKAQKASQIPIVVDLHPDRPEGRGLWPPTSPDKPMCKLPNDPTFEQIEAASGRCELNSQPHTVAGGSMYVSGEIKRQTEYETGLFGATQWVDGAWQKGPTNPGWLVMDERCLVIDVKNKGLVVFSSCSHAGIVNVCMTALEAFNHTRPLYAVIGGYHLGGPFMEDRIPMTVKYFAEEVRTRPKFIIPMHCTGFKAKVALRNALGEAVVPVGVGTRIIFKADE